jgi:nitrite reductase/ring-hydroxylating ferredoxin subunit
MGSFNVPTGNVVAPPCEVPLRTYQVILKGEDVFVDLSRNAAGAPG